MMLRRALALLTIAVPGGLRLGGRRHRHRHQRLGQRQHRRQVDQSAAVALPFPIRVTVAEVPEVTAVTDDDGTFALRGRFSGAVTLQFSNAATGAPIGPLPLEIPAGSVTVLENIEITTTAPEPDRVQPRAVRQFDLAGRIDLAECGDDGTLLVTDGARPPRQFLITLTADTDIVSRDGTPLDCSALRAGRRVRVEGFLRLRTLTLVATEVIVAPPPAPPPDAPRRERFRGRRRRRVRPRPDFTMRRRRRRCGSAPVSA